MLSSLTPVAPLVRLLVPFPLVLQFIYDRSIRVPIQEQPSYWRVATPHALRAVYTCLLHNCGGLSKDAEEFV